MIIVVLRGSSDDILPLNRMLGILLYSAFSKTLQSLFRPFTKTRRNKSWHFLETDTIYTSHLSVIICATDSEYVHCNSLRLRSIHISVNLTLLTYCCIIGNFVCTDGLGMILVIVMFGLETRNKLLPWLLELDFIYRVCFTEQI